MNKYFYIIERKTVHEIHRIIDAVKKVFTDDGFITVNTMYELASLEGRSVLKLKEPVDLIDYLNNRMVEINNYESADKMVSHPDHYQSSSGLEVIDVIAAFTDGLNGIEATDSGNILKYACRWHKKNGIQDLEKILWYTQHLINHLKNKEKENTDNEKK